MRRNIQVLLFFCLCLLLPPGAAHAETDSVVVEALLAEIGRTLVRVRNEADSQSLPPLSSATLKVQSEVKQTVEGGISFWVLKANAKVSQLAVQTMTIVLEPPKPVDRSDVSSVSDALTSAILAAARASEAARKADPPLRASSIEVAIKFVVDTSASGGAGGLKLLPITAELSASVSQAATQEIIIRFTSP